MRVVGGTLYTSHYEWTYAADASGAKGTKPVDAPGKARQPLRSRRRATTSTGSTSATSSTPR